MTWGGPNAVGLGDSTPLQLRCYRAWIRSAVPCSRDAHYTVSCLIFYLTWLTYLQHYLIYNTNATIAHETMRFKLWINSIQKVNTTPLWFNVSYEWIQIWHISLFTKEYWANLLETLQVAFVRFAGQSVNSYLHVYDWRLEISPRIIEYYIENSSIRE